MATEFKNVRKARSQANKAKQTPVGSYNRYGAEIIPGQENAEGIFMNEKGEVRIELTLDSDPTMQRQMLKRYKELGARVDSELSDDIDIVMWMPKEKREEHIRKAQDADVERQQRPKANTQAGLESEHFSKENPISVAEMESLLSENDMAQLA